jgi:23S rRNA (uracil1939-C5)-methyltransferase
MHNCSYFPLCTGCSAREKPYLQQIENKKNDLINLLNKHHLAFKTSFECISIGENGLRDRVDFTIEYDDIDNRHNIGFYNNSKKIIQINKCLQLSNQLQSIYTEFIQLSFYIGTTPLKKGSVRLRAGHNGIKGCWLDFSNIDIKNLLNDGKLLHLLLEKNFIVEIGQKGKRLVVINNQLKLTDAVAEYWFSTVDAKKNEELPLKCLISDFTQPSITSAKRITDELINLIGALGITTDVIEFGSGIGQYTLALLSSGYKVIACEINKSACTYLVENTEIHNLSSNLKLHIGDFHKLPLPVNTSADLVIVNPSRSGLKDFVFEISKLKPKYLIYISCFPESMCSDLEKLNNLYSLCNIKIIDQFPQTFHYETMILLELF